jgi:uncharacterized tellurite resistance protein B-like protein
MHQRLREFYSHIAVHATADLEHEAVIELLLLVMVADRHISDEELNEIRAISNDSGWESSTFSFDQYLGQAMARVRSAVAGNSTDALLDDIDHRVSSPMLRHSLYSAARDVAGADHTIDPEEESLLGQVAARFA